MGTSRDRGIALYRYEGQLERRLGVGRVEIHYRMRTDDVPPTGSARRRECANSVAEAGDPRCATQKSGYGTNPLTPV